MDNDEEIRQRNKDAFQRAALFWIDLANQRLSDFNKQLLSFAAVLLPLTASVVVVDFIKLKEFEKTLLIISWVSLGISIISGVIQIMVDARYFEYLSRDSSTREAIWSSNKSIEEMHEKTDKLGAIKPKSTHLPLWIQTLMLGQGLLLIVIIAILLLLRK